MYFKNFCGAFSEKLKVETGKALRKWPPKAGQHPFAIVASITLEMKVIICTVLESCLAHCLFIFPSYSLVCCICFLFVYLFAVYKKKNGYISFSLYNQRHYIVIPSNSVDFFWTCFEHFCRFLVVGVVCCCCCCCLLGYFSCFYFNINILVSTFDYLRNSNFLRYVFLFKLEKFIQYLER